MGWIIWGEIHQGRGFSGEISLVPSQITPKKLLIKTFPEWTFPSINFFYDLFPRVLVPKTTVKTNNWIGDVVAKSCLGTKPSQLHDWIFDTDFNYNAEALFHSKERSHILPNSPLFFVTPTFLYLSIQLNSFFGRQK